MNTNQHRGIHLLRYHFENQLSVGGKDSPYVTASVNQLALGKGIPYVIITGTNQQAGKIDGEASGVATDRPDYGEGK